MATDKLTAEQLRERILELIGQWLRNPKVQASEPAVLVLNALAGDIQIMNLKALPDEHITALRKYGKHLTGCACFDEVEEKACDCGFGQYEAKFR